MDETNDVAVFAAEAQICGAYNLIVSPKGIAMGRDAFFLGFPYRLHVPVLNQPIPFRDPGYPLPLVKRACVSAVLLQGCRSDFLLDGRNNPGFSGAPVVFTTPSDKRVDPATGIIIIKYRLAGSVSGFITSPLPVKMGGRDLKATIDDNTGLIKCPSIIHAMRAIIAKPVGPKISAPGSIFVDDDFSEKRGKIEEHPDADWA